jgi:hypothetical protein
MRTWTDEPLLTVPPVWNEYIDRILEVMPVPIVISLGLSLPFSPCHIDSARDVAYALICIYEFLKVCCAVSRRSVAADDNPITSAYSSRHSARCALSIILYFVHFSLVCFQLSELLYFATAALRALALEAGVFFPERRALSLRLSQTYVNFTISEICRMLPGTHSRIHWANKKDEKGKQNHRSFTAGRIISV